MEQIMAQAKLAAIRSPSDRRMGSEPAKPTLKNLPAMPLEVVYDSLDMVVSFEKRGDEIVYTFRNSKKRRFNSSKLNAFALRETFLDIRTPGEAFDFLDQTGSFRGPVSRRSYERLTWSEFKSWQEIVGLFLQRGYLPVEQMSRTDAAVSIRYDVPSHLKAVLSDLSSSESACLHGFPEQLVIRRDLNGDGRAVLYAEIVVNTTLDAILATVYVDHLNGINFERCALSDCNRLYEMTSKHERQYCTPEHAHKASVRRRRAEAKPLANIGERKDEVRRS
jgi:hypothetical protein